MGKNNAAENEVNIDQDTRIEDIAAQMGQAREPQAQTFTAFVVPTSLFTQMVEAIRGSVCHRDAAPIMDQVATLQPQELTLRQ